MALTTGESMGEQHILILFDSDVTKAGLIGREMAVQLGLGECASEEVGIVASELASHLLKIGTINGELVFREIHGETGSGVELISRDKGPGVNDTVVSTRKWHNSLRPPAMNISVLSRPCSGEIVSGDAWFIRQTAVFSLCAVIDVLGHGPDAHEVAVQLQSILEDNYTRPLQEIISICHEKLRRTRGSAMSLAKINFSEKVFEYISIGNIETRIYDDTHELVRPFCLNGTLGMALESQRVVKYPFPAGSTIVMFSDGINGRFKIAPRLLEISSQAIAAYIFDNYALNSDDATVLVGRLAHA